MQSFTVFPAIGELVFANRPMIIGFLHLVLLGFVSLYLIAHFIHAGYLKPHRATNVAATVFASAVVANEVVLMMQGLGVMLMTSSNMYPWMLWGTGAALLAGACMLAYSFYRANDIKKRDYNQLIENPTFQIKNI